MEKVSKEKETLLFQKDKLIEKILKKDNQLTELK